MKIFRLRLMPPTDEAELSLYLFAAKELFWGTSSRRVREDPMKTDMRAIFDAKRALPGDKGSPRQERPHEKRSSGDILSPIFFCFFDAKRAVLGDKLSPILIFDIFDAKRALLGG